MDNLIEQARAVYEGEIDFKAQSRVETLSTGLLTLSGLFAFLAGFLTQNIYNTLYVGLSGTALTFLVAVPPWPFWNRDPVNWLPAKTGRMAGIDVAGLDFGSAGGEGRKGR